MNIHILDTWISKYLDKNDDDPKSEFSLEGWFKRTQKSFCFLVLDPRGKTFELRAQTGFSSDSIDELRQTSINNSRCIFF